MMRDSKVVNVKLGTPPKGCRTIVWGEGSKERTMILRAPDDWDARIAYNAEDDGVIATFCIAVSPDESEMSITKMKPSERPKKLKLSGDDISKRLAGPPSKMSASEIARALDEHVDPG